VFWESPDVWTEGSAGINQPVVGEPTHVFARITNLGLQDAYGVTVKYWWANPAAAITEATSHLIAADTVTVPAGYTKTFQSPVDWTPAEQNGGHECLLVEAYLPVLDGLTQPMEPAGDRHVGQKNECLLALAPGEQFQFLFDAQNFTRKQAKVAVEARPGMIPRNIAKEFANNVLWGTEIFDPAGTLPLDLNISSKPVATLPATVLSRPRDDAEEDAEEDDSGGNALRCLGPPLASQAMKFGAGEVRRVEVQGALPYTARRGEVYVLRFFQRIGAVVAGGYTLFVTLDPRRC
jgi:hypothetical protein